MGKSFIIKVNQQVLKFLLEQRIGIEAQHKWLSKLMGYEFKIGYKKGKENLVENAICRKEKVETECMGLLAQITFPTAE